MIKQKQLFRHDPDNGVYGDCYRTVLACLLDKKPEDVPHFAAMHWGDDKAFNAEISNWLSSQGYREVTFAYITETLDEMRPWIISSFGDAFYLLHGRSANNVNHVVIGHRGEIYWDTALDNSGIVAPLLDMQKNPTDQYQISFLVPIEFTSEYCGE